MTALAMPPIVGFADYVSTLPVEGGSKPRDALREAYLDGELDGARSHAATAWVVKGRAAKLRPFLSIPPNHNASSRAANASL